LKALNDSINGETSPSKAGKQIRFADTTKTSNMSLMRKSTYGAGENQKRTKAILSDEHE
jgi:hypothetical protein